MVYIMDIHGIHSGLHSIHGGGNVTACPSTRCKGWDSHIIEFVCQTQCLKDEEHYTMIIGRYVD